MARSRRAVKPVKASAKLQARARAATGTAPSKNRGVQAVKASAQRVRGTRRVAVKHSQALAGS